MAFRSGIGLLALVALGGAAQAQSRNAPKRPRLVAAADTNDAHAYYDFGVAVLRREPWTAAAAFYWASRLDPGWPEAFYAQRVAGLMAREDLLIGYLEGARSVVESRDAQRLDSLEDQAQRLNPFFRRSLDETLFAGYLMARYKQSRSRYGERPPDLTDRSELEYLVDQYLRSGSNIYLRAAIAASRGRVAEALEFYRQLLPQVGVKAEIHADRARLFYVIASYDSALVELQAALSELRQMDTVRLTHLYVSRELMEHAIGVIHEAAGDTAAARQAYGRALQENLAYAPAHVRLAGGQDHTLRLPIRRCRNSTWRCRWRRARRRCAQPTRCCWSRRAGGTTRSSTCAAPPISSRIMRCPTTCSGTSPSCKATATRRWRVIGRFSRGRGRAIRSAPWWSNASPTSAPEPEEEESCRLHCSWPRSSPGRRRRSRRDSSTAPSASRGRHTTTWCTSQPTTPAPRAGP